MTKRHASAVLKCLVLLSACVLMSACASSGVVNNAKTVPKNSELLIGEFGFWKRDCTDRHFDISIERYPKFGDLRFEVGELTIPPDALVGSSGKCAGLKVQSKKVVYVADPGFVGSDTVSYVVKSTVLLGNAIYNVDLNVQ